MRSFLLFGSCFLLLSSLFAFNWLGCSCVCYLCFYGIFLFVITDKLCFADVIFFYCYLKKNLFVDVEFGWVSSIWISVFSLSDNQ